MTLPQSGIYKITNTINNKIYIGQSQNVWMRRHQHWTALKNKHHENKQMQKDWNKNNKVEYCPLNKLNEREKYWIDKYNSIERGYNQGWARFQRNTSDRIRVNVKKSQVILALLFICSNHTKDFYSFTNVLW